jgi:hypothetical protein
MTCDKCKTGEVQVVRIRRFSRAVVAMGAALWILALVGATGGTALFYAYRPPIVPPVDPAVRAKQAAMAKLREMDNLPPAIITSFEQTGEVSDDALERLKSDVQNDVELVISDYHHTVRTAPPPEPPRPWWANHLLWVMWGACLGAFVAGVITRVRMEIERCAQCGALFEGDDTSLF